MKGSKQEYVGFINAYNAKNIASIEDTLLYKSDEIEDLLSDIQDKNRDDQDLSKAVDRIKTALKKIDDSVSKFFTSGELVMSSLDLLKAKDTVKTKQIVLNYGQVAKLTNDKKLKEQAVQLGSQFLGE